MVLLRVEHLQQRRRRISAEVAPHLVDLVEHEHRVVRPGLTQPLNDAPGERPHIGAPVTADLRLVMNAAEADAHELAPERARYAFAEARLSNTGRAHEAQDRPLHVVFELAHGEVLDDPLFDLVEVVVVLVQDRARPLDVELVLGLNPPRDVEQRLEVRTRDAILAGGRLHHTQPVELLAAGLFDLLRQIRFLDRGRDILEVATLTVELAELLFDRLELLAQVVLALILVDLFFDLALDLVADAQHLELARQQRHHGLQTVLQIHRLQDRLFLFGRDVHVGGHEVAELAGVVDPIDHLARLFGHLRDELHHLLGGALEVHEERFDLDVIDVLRFFVIEHLELADKERVILLELIESDPRLSLNDHAVVVARDLHDLEDPRHRTNLVHVLEAWLVSLRVLLRQDRDRLLALDRILDQFHTLRAPHGQRHDDLGEQYSIAQRQDAEVLNLRRKLILIGHHEAL